MAVTLTDVAVKEVKHILDDQRKKMNGNGSADAADVADDNNGDVSLPDKMYLRVGVKGGGCSGFNYTLDLTDQKSEEDEVFEYDGLEVICDPKSYLYLNGVTVDFRDEVMGRGFVFSNPNATSSCGCGSSFSV